MGSDIEADERSLQSWTTERDAVAAAVLSQGYDRDVGAFTQSFNSRSLDASALQIPLVGFLPCSDPRVRSTIAAVEAHLTDEAGRVYRYRTDDGLPDGEGTFLLCTFWPAQAHALAGDVERAREVFERGIVARNDVGLLSEEVGRGELLGNFPQGFSHIGLVNAAWAIAEAERRESGRHEKGARANE